MARAGWLAGSVAGLLMLCAPALAQEITGATYTDPTTRYDHGVLGDEVEWGALRLDLSDGRQLTMTLPESQVFEDTAPRLADVNGDGAPEVIVVEASLRLGARLAVWGPEGRLAATPYMGRPHRWLAPVGVADLDGDGMPEIAYIDRPHLLRLLRVWRFEDNKLVHVADAPNLTNHRIGWDHIPGGIRDCGDGPEIVVASRDWSRVMAVQFVNDRLESRVLGPASGPDSLNAALTCR